MLRIFVGFDSCETIAYHVLSNSIMRRASVPVSITPLLLSQLPMWREREPDQTSDFSFTRYLVPWLCRYEGLALYLDCDMLCRCDVAELFAAADRAADVSVVKHDYTPKDASKFLGKTQTNYERKNWSSAMLFNAAACTNLNLSTVNSADATWLRQLRWADCIGELPATFNHLVGEYAPSPEAKIVHFTRGTPCFAKYRNCEFADDWHAERRLLNYHNPVGEYSLADKAA